MLLPCLLIVLHLQGFLEQTYLFYGFYKVDKIHFPYMSYNLPLAYLLATVGYMLLSLIWIVKRYCKGKSVIIKFTWRNTLWRSFLCLRSATGFKRKLVQDEDRFQSFCNKIFSGWDFCINDKNAARLKRSSLLYELKVSWLFCWTRCSIRITSIRFRSLFLMCLMF